MVTFPSQNVVLGRAVATALTTISLMIFGFNTKQVLGIVVQSMRVVPNQDVSFCYKMQAVMEIISERYVDLLTFSVRIFGNVGGFIVQNVSFRSLVTPIIADEIQRLS